MTGATLVGAGAASAAVNGSGSSFVNTAYSKWCGESGFCSYTSKGSGGGITDFTNGVTDFGASDATLSPDQLAKLSASRNGAGVVYFPTLLGAITVPVNLPNIKHIQLDGPTIAGIFKGTITKWNDPKIVADNVGVKPTVRLPDAPISMCVRADGSGTSFSFARFLGNVDLDFAAKIPASTTPSWPESQSTLKFPSNSGVANCVKTTANAIGYVDLPDALNAGLTDQIASVGAGAKATATKKYKVTFTTKVTRTKVKGKTVVKRVKVAKRTIVTIPGKQKTFVLPSGDTIAAAAGAPDAANDPNLTPDFTKYASEIANAYPITITSWVLAYDDFGKAGKSGSLAGVKDVLNYFYGDTAQKQLAALGYGTLPSAIVDKAKANIATLK